ncbi:MAG TPA: NAD(P)H-hydrate dehydratase [Draconibacterium sp.]|nr:NAD(P)H-hydrate dehydratase [Draconibacterium sp.]
MKLFTTKQIAALDKYTIENEPVSDIDLMERASLQITNWLVQNFSTEQKLLFFAGPGNNGGDALAIARQIAELDFVCEVYLVDLGRELKGSPAINRHRLELQQKVKISTIKTLNDFPEINKTDTVIDGLFGSGLTRPLEGLAAEIVQKINTFQNKVISIDIPSGLMGEDNSENIARNIIQADYTLTFQFPKISFLFAENEKYTGVWEVLPIRLHPDGIAQTETSFLFIEKEDIQPVFQKRSKFGHKGTYGHALLIAGSFGKMGAAVLAAKACLRSGAGLLTAQIPHLGYPIIQTAVPEAMANVDQHDYTFTEFPDLSQFSAIGVGPGIGQKSNTKKALCELLEKSQVPLVIDADALNILAENPAWLEKLPGNSILTPHPGEFKRLVGESSNSYENIQKQLEFSKRYKVFVVLKGAFTTVSTPDGKLYFNSTGNPGMATAGSGDVLTGIILGLLTQGIHPEKAAVAGAYIHGLAGDLAANEKSQYSIIAGDIIKYLGKAFLTVETHSK